MQILNRINAISYDPTSFRFKADVAVMLNDGGEEVVTASVVSSPPWHFERVARELISAAKYQFDA